MPLANPLDFYDINSLLSDDERLIRETVGRFVDREVTPIIGDCFAAERFPSELVPRLAELGLFGATLQGYGCPGLAHTAYGIICEELERGDSSVRSCVSVQSSLVMGAIHAFGSEEQRSRWLPELARGTKLGCFALTESHGGSDPARMRTRARRRGGDWTLDGAKHWITNGALADVAVVWAIADDGVKAFLVEKGASGFDARVIKNKLSLRASSTAELALADVRVPDGARLPEANGIKTALRCLDDARFGIAWGACGAARACLDTALRYTESRELFGRPLNQTQLIQTRLADGVRKLTAAQLVAWRLAKLKEQGLAQGAQVSLAKWNNVRAALDIARDCRDILGAAGITLDHVPMRHMLNLETVITYEGTESIHELVVGRALTGQSAF
ncbi:MAG TPA: acyl-CoA dehydrogenase family protein [Gammaproteobacteria bacterium]